MIHCLKREPRMAPAAGLVMRTLVAPAFDSLKKLMRIVTVSCLKGNVYFA